MYSMVNISNMLYMKAAKSKSQEFSSVYFVSTWDDDYTANLL